MARSIVYSDAGRLVFEDGTPVPLSAFGPGGAEPEADLVAGDGAVALVITDSTAYGALVPGPADETVYILTDTGQIYFEDTLVAEVNAT